MQSKDMACTQATQVKPSKKMRRVDHLKLTHPAGEFSLLHSSLKFLSAQPFYPGPWLLCSRQQMYHHRLQLLRQRWVRVNWGFVSFQCIMLSLGTDGTYVPVLYRRNISFSLELFPLIFAEASTSHLG